jgi:acyl-CoA thioester hydrolase
MPGPRSYATTWRVRTYELDSNGHVNNSVYVAYAEEVAYLHSEALGYGQAWTRDNGGAWVVRRHAITYFYAARYGDELELTTTVQEMRGARAIRNTVIRLLRDQSLVVEMETEWVWTRLSTGRPSRIPAAALAAFSVDS